MTFRTISPVKRMVITTSMKKKAVEIDDVGSHSGFSIASIMDEIMISTKMNGSNRGWRTTFVTEMRKALSGGKSPNDTP